MIARHTRRFIWQNFVGTVAFDMVGLIPREPQLLEFPAGT